MKDELGEYIEIYEVVGRYGHSCNSHETVIARATNEQTANSILKTVSQLKHRDDRSHRIYRAYGERMLEKFCRFFAECSSEEFSAMIDKEFEADNDYYQGDSKLRQIEKKIDEAVGAELDEMMDNHPYIFKAWYAENGFDYKHFDCFFPRVSKAYVTFGGL